MTLVFPQLKTGAGGQYPLVRRRKWASVTNVLTDGRVVNYASAIPPTNIWELTLADLTDDEADSIQELFQSVEGRRGTFTFVDPTANLLAHSEELDSPCWTKGPMVELVGGIADPLGGVRGFRFINAGQAPQNLSQTVSAPAWFGYCFSVYAKSVAASSISLTRSSASSTHQRLFALGSDWTRCTLSGTLNSSGENVSFALGLPAGGSIDIFGIQAEAQPGASSYKRTAVRNGVFTNARFDHDTLRLISEGPDQNRFNLRIIAKD